MVDITLVLFRHDNPNATDNRVGDVHTLYLTSELGDTRRFDQWVYVHITGVPNVGAAKLKRFRNKLRSYDRVVVGTLPDGTDQVVARNYKKWGVHPRALPTGVRQALNRDGEITVTWTQVKNYLKRKNKLVTLRDVFNAADHDDFVDADLDDV